MAKLNAKACKHIMDAQTYMMCTIRDAVEATDDTAEQDALTDFYDTCGEVFNKFNAENDVSCTKAQKFFLNILGLCGTARKPKEESKEEPEDKEEELKKVGEDNLPPNMREFIKGLLEILESE